MSSDHYDPSCDLSVQDIVVNSITNPNTLQVHIITLFLPVTWILSLPVYPLGASFECSTAAENIIKAAQSEWQDRVNNVKGHAK